MFFAGVALIVRIRIVSIVAYLAVVTLVSKPVVSHAQSLEPYGYAIGEIDVVDYYVDPVRGNDTSSGMSRGSPLRTVQRAWQRIPSNTPLSQGVRINLAAGDYGTEELPNYWENKIGTARAPIILRTDPNTSDTARLVRDINMAGVSHFYLLKVEISPQGGGDTFHCERCNYVLLRGSIFNGGSMTDGAHETIKVNQSQYIYIENNQIAFADDNAIDFVGVQYGHIVGNRIHSAQDWCVYVKGGSAYIRIDSNEISNCGVGGFTAGQGSGFQFMTSPWIHYEAYDIKFINNVLFDITGAAFGVNGGYNVLLAHNSAFNVGRRSHLVEAVFGERTCDGERDGSANSQCAQYNAAGGWGPSLTRLTPEPIGNRNVSILNNVIVNPSSVVSPQHFAIYGPRQSSAGANIPSPQRSDENLVIKGNVIVNGDSNTPMGIEDESQGCSESNATCSLQQLVRDNSINNQRIAFQAPNDGDLRPREEDESALKLSAVELLDFMGGDRESVPLAPQGELGNEISRDYAGVSRTGLARVAGAFLNRESPRSPQPIGELPLQDDPSSGPSNPPELELVKISKLTVRQSRVKRKLQLSITVTVSGEPSSVKVSVERPNRSVLSATVVRRSGASVYNARLVLQAPAGAKLAVVIKARSHAGEETMKRKPLSAR